MGGSTADGSATTLKANPPELPLGGDRLLHIVRPRTRCERDESLARGANEKPRALVRAWGRCQPPAAGLSRETRDPWLCAPSSPTVCPENRDSRAGIEQKRCLPTIL